MEMKNTLLTKLIEDEKIVRYKELELIINSNEEILKNLDELKNIQKQIVHAKTLIKKDMLEKLNLEYEKKLESIEDFPLMAEYLDLQTEINESLQAFKDIIEKGIDSDLQVK